jgi:hypothetical protein
MAEIDERINTMEEFKAKLKAWKSSGDPKLREWLNQNMPRVRRKTLEANTHVILTVYRPPAVGGPIMRVDPFNYMFDNVYLMSMVPHLIDKLDKTIGVLRKTTQSDQPSPEARIKSEVQSGYAFVAMPMDENDHQLVDVLEAIKAAAKECGITAERIDDDERSERRPDVAIYTQS